VKFSAVPDFSENIRIARAGKNFRSEKIPAFSFSREKITRTGYHTLAVRMIGYYP